MNITQQSLSQILGDKRAYKVMSILKNHLVSIHHMEVTGATTYEFEIVESIDKFRKLARAAYDEKKYKAFDSYFEYLQIFNQVREL